MKQTNYHKWLHFLIVRRQNKNKFISINSNVIEITTTRLCSFLFCAGLFWRALQLISKLRQQENCPPLGGKLLFYSLRLLCSTIIANVSLFCKTIVVRHLHAPVVSLDLTAREEQRSWTGLDAIHVGMITIGSTLNEIKIEWSWSWIGGRCCSAEKCNLNE